jgi:hypothetical protein
MQQQYGSDVGLMDSARVIDKIFPDRLCWWQSGMQKKKEGLHEKYAHTCQQ